MGDVRLSVRPFVYNVGACCLEHGRSNPGLINGMKEDNVARMFHGIDKDAKKHSVAERAYRRTR